MVTSALRESVEKNRVVNVKRLIDSGVSVLVTDDRRNTPVHMAAEAGALEVLQLLSDTGAPIDPPNWIGQTPLSLAARNGHLQVVKYLCEHGAVTHGPHLNTAPLSAAAAAGHLEIVKYLVEERRVPVNSLERPFGATPLFLAARFSKLEVVRYLMDKGADPNIANAQGETALGRVERLVHAQPGKPTPAKAELLNGPLACLGGGDAKTPRVSPSAGPPRAPKSLLSHLIKPRKEWHFWQ
jgi:hypothetical protein